jgi:hypothetical protein
VELLWKGEIVMMFKKTGLLLSLVFIFLSCNNKPDDDNGNDSALASVTFHNRSTYSVDIFYNFNPQIFEPTTFNNGSYKGTVDTIGRELEVKVPASTDLLLGDTFYLRYKILLANSSETGTAKLFIHAERTMSNIPFVIESGRSYNIFIEEPPVNELRFVNGIVKVRNMTTDQIWVEDNGVILPQKGRETAWLTLGQFGFYELPLPFLAESWTIDYLKSRDSNSNRTPFPSFEMERGKLYSFEIRNTGISGPDVTNINPLAF